MTRLPWAYPQRCSCSSKTCFLCTFKSFTCQWQNLQNMIVFVNVIYNSQDLFVNKTMLKLCHNASVFNLLVIFEFLKNGVNAPQKPKKRNIILKVGGWELKFQNKNLLITNNTITHSHALPIQVKEEAWQAVGELDLLSRCPRFKFSSDH